MNASLTPEQRWLVTEMIKRGKPEDAVRWWPALRGVALLIAIWLTAWWMGEQV